MKKNRRLMATLLTIALAISLVPLTLLTAAAALANVLVPTSLVYGIVYNFVDDLAVVGSAEWRGRQFGVIDKQGNYVVPLSYSGILSYSEGLAAVSMGEYPDEKFGFIDTTGAVAIPLTFDRTGSFSDGLAMVQLDGKYGFIDKTGAIVIPIEYDGVYPFEDGYAKVIKGEYPNRRFGVVDKTGTLIIPIEYDDISRDYNTPNKVFYEGMAEVFKDNKCGFADESGSIVVPPIYDYVSHFADGMATVSQSNKYGVIDAKGSVIAPIEYDDMYAFTDDLAWAKKDGAWGILNAIKSAAGTIVNVLVPPTLVYDRVYQFSEGLAVVHMEGKDGYVDKTGAFVIEPQFDSADTFSGGLGRVGSGFFPDELCGFINTSGALVIPMEYNEAGRFVDGLARVAKGDFPERRYGYIDTSGRTVIPLEHNWIGAFSNGYAMANIDGKYGCFDKAGNIVVSLEYDTVYVPSYGKIWVQNDELWGILEVGGSPGTTAPPPPALVANPTAATVLVNGEPVAFDAYNINDNNYFKLRDLAYVLTDTEKCFEVDWDGEKQAITLISGEAYTEVGGEMEGKGSEVKTPLPSNAKVYLDGDEMQFTAYNIEGNNYFKLRDIGEAFDFGVDWNGELQTIVIDTGKGYTPD